MMRNCDGSLPSPADCEHDEQSNPVRQSSVKDHKQTGLVSLKDQESVKKHFYSARAFEIGFSVWMFHCLLEVEVLVLPLPPSAGGKR